MDRAFSSILYRKGGENMKFPSVYILSVKLMLFAMDLDAATTTIPTQSPSSEAGKLILFFLLVYFCLVIKCKNITLKCKDAVFI